MAHNTNSLQSTTLVLRAIGCLAALSVAFAPKSSAQIAYDASWYDGSLTNVKIAVVQDGVYKVTGADLEAAGVNLATVSPASLRLFENGSEIPLDYAGGAQSFSATDFFRFVGRRNTGSDEAWAYDNVPERQTSDHFSLYTDTTHYWLRFGGEDGLRYVDEVPTGTPVETVSTTIADLRSEQDLVYYPGQGSSAGDPIYSNAEGYYEKRIQHNTSQNILVTPFSFTLPDRSTSEADTFTVSTLVASETVSRHLVYLRIRLNVNGTPTLTTVDSVDWSGIDVQRLQYSGPMSSLPPGSTISGEVASTNIFGSGTPNNLLLDWINTSYVREAIPISGQLELRSDLAGPFTYEISGLNQVIRVLEPASHRAFTVAPSGNSATFVKDAVGSTPSYWVVADGMERTPSRIFVDEPSFLASGSLTADYVIIAAPALLESANAMAAYRQTELGGSHQTLVVNAQDVFDEFDYGRPTPIAIRRFIRHALTWTEPIRYLTLWGDALYAKRSRTRQDWELPAFGHTVSDSWFAMQNNGPTDFSESIAIGRIPIRSNEKGDVFRQKMQTYESQPLSTWQKRSLFLAGGLTDSERTRLQQSSLQWSNLAASDPMGMDTLHFFKSSTSVLDPTFQDSLQAALELGASWEVYFGHSATQTWEIVTDPPSQYNNATRLPIVLSLGCFTGDYATGSGIDTDILSFSEQLVIESLNGSIAHWGASSSGTIGASSRLSNEVHQSVFVDTVRVLGDAMRIAKARYNDLYTDPVSVKHLLQYGLIGDPATRISLPSQPDFRIEAADIRVTPVAPVPADRELTVSVAVNNVGLTVPDSVLVELVHTLPNSSTITTSRLLPPFGSRTTQQFRVDINDNAVGQNGIGFTADVDDRYSEGNELNNSSQQPVTVFSTGLSVISPAAFALFPASDIALRVTSTTSEANPPGAVFQIDKDPSFATQDLMEATVPTNGLVAEWRPADLTDGTYYWRVRVDRTEQSDVWTNGSFTIDSALGETGWMQRGRLFEGNEHSPTLLPYDNGWLLNDFNVVVSVASERGSGSELGQFTVGSDIYERLGLGFGVLVMDGRNGTVKTSSSSPLYANDFVDPSVAYNRLTTSLNAATNGDYIFVRTRHLGNKNNETVIPDSIKTLFANLGSTAIETLTYQDLWIFTTRIGFPETTFETTSLPSSGINEIIRSFDPVFQYEQGTVVSPAIGPTSDWESLRWDEDLPNGTSAISLDVVSASGQTVLLSGLNGGGPIDLSPIDARLHPFIRLQATLSDQSFLATPQLTNWRVSHKSVPEVAIDFASISLSADTVRAGEPVTIAASVWNLSDTVVDSAIVRIDVIDANNVTTNVSADTLTSFTGSRSVNASIETEGIAGTNTIRIEARQPGLVDQVQVNNVAVAPLVVIGDTTPPEFVLTVDGQALPHDPNPVTNLQDPALPFVSNKPLIELHIEDDNPFALLESDSMTVSVKLNGRTIPHSELDISGSDDANAIVVSLQPDFSGVDSTHTVVVEIQDVVGNHAADSPFQVHFRTQSAMQLETVYPYPNPMNNFTNFAFNLRGSTAMELESMRLRIYTVSGRLVREFNLTEDPSDLAGGMLRIGWNKLRWDGRDSDGDLVATGVYLYRVFARVDGEELRSANASEVEKVVVIR